MVRIDGTHVFLAKTLIRKLDRERSEWQACIRFRDMVRYAGLSNAGFIIHKAWTAIRQRRILNCK